MSKTVEFTIESIDESAAILLFSSGEKIIWPKIYVSDDWQAGMNIKMSSEVMTTSKVIDISALDLLNKLLRPS